MKRIKLLALLAGLMLAATACPTGGQQDGDGANLSGVTLEIAAVWSGGEQEAFEEVLALFEEQTGATVNFTSTGDDIATVLGTRIERGEQPDVAVLPQPGLLRDLAGRDQLIPIEDAVGDEVDENYAPVWRELGSVDDTLYGVWFKAGSKSTVWYNVGVFEDAGVTPPETLEEFLERAQTVLDFGLPPISVGGGDGWTLTDWFENVFIQIGGPELYDQLTNHEIPWTHPKVIEALEVMAPIFEETFLVGGRSGALQTNFDNSVINVFTDPPRGAMVYEGDFVAGVITDNTEAVVGEDADFFPFPTIGDAEPSVIAGGDVAVLMEDTEGGRALIEFLATPEAAEVWAAQGGFISPTQTLDLNVYPDEISRKLAESLTQAEVLRFDLSDLQPAEFGATVGSGLFQLFQDFLRNPDDIDGVTQRMEEAAARAFG